MDDAPFSKELTNNRSHKFCSHDGATMRTRFFGFFLGLARVDRFLNAHVLMKAWDVRRLGCTREAQACGVRLESQRGVVGFRGAIRAAPPRPARNECAGGRPVTGELSAENWALASHCAEGQARGDPISVAHGEAPAPEVRGRPGSRAHANQDFIVPGNRLLHIGEAQTSGGPSCL